MRVIGVLSVLVALVAASEMPNCDFSTITSSPSSVSSSTSTFVRIALENTGLRDASCTVANIATQSWTLRFSVFQLALQVDTALSKTETTTFRSIEIPALFNTSLLQPNTSVLAVPAQILMNGVPVVHVDVLFHYYRHISLRQATITLDQDQATATVDVSANAFPVLPNATAAMKLRLLLDNQPAPIDIPLPRAQRVSNQLVQASLLRAGIDTIVKQREHIVSLLAMYSVDGSRYQSFAIAEPTKLFASIQPLPPTTAAPSSGAQSSDRPSTDYWLPLLPLLLACMVVAVLALVQRNRVVLPAVDSHPDGDRGSSRANPLYRGAENDLYDDGSGQLLPLPEYAEPGDLLQLAGISNPGYAITAQSQELYEEVTAHGPAPVLNFGQALYHEVDTDQRTSDDALPPLPAGGRPDSNADAVYGNVGDQDGVAASGQIVYGNSNYGVGNAIYAAEEDTYGDGDELEDFDDGYLQVDESMDGEDEPKPVMNVYGDSHEDLYGNGELNLPSESYEQADHKGPTVPAAYSTRPGPASKEDNQLARDSLPPPVSEDVKKGNKTNGKMWAIIVLLLGLLVTVVWYAIVFSKAPSTSREAPPSASQSASQPALLEQSVVPNVLLTPTNPVFVHHYDLDLTVTVGDVSLSQAWVQTLWYAGTSAVQHHWVSWTQEVTSSWSGQPQPESAFLNATQLDRLFQTNLNREPVTAVKQTITNVWLLDLEKTQPTLSTACRTPTAATVVFDHARVPPRVDSLSSVQEGDIWQYTWTNQHRLSLGSLFPSLLDMELGDLNTSAEVIRVVRYDNRLKRLQDSTITVTLVPDDLATTSTPTTTGDNDNSTTVFPPMPNTPSSLPGLSLVSTMKYSSTDPVDEQVKADAIAEASRPGLLCVSLSEEQRQQQDMYHRDLTEVASSESERRRRSVALQPEHVQHPIDQPQVSVHTVQRRGLDDAVADSATALFRFSVEDMVDDLKAQVAEAVYTNHRNYQYGNPLREVIQLPDARFSIHFGYVQAPSVTVTLTSPLYYDVSINGQLRSEIRHESIVSQGCFFACWAVVSDTELKTTTDTVEEGRVGVDVQPSRPQFVGLSNATFTQATFVDGSVDLADLALVNCDTLVAQLGSYMQDRGLNDSALECRESSLVQAALAITTASPDFSDVYQSLADAMASRLNNAAGLAHAVDANVVQGISHVLSASFTANYAHVDVAANVTVTSATGVAPVNANKQPFIPVSLASISTADALLVYRSPVIAQACAQLLTRSAEQALLFDPRPGLTPYLKASNIPDPYTRITLKNVVTNINTASFEISATVQMSGFALKQDALANKLAVFALDAPFRFFGTADVQANRYLQLRVTTASLMTSDAETVTVNGGWKPDQTLVFFDVRELVSDLLFVWANSQLERVLVLNAPVMESVKVELNEGYALFRGNYHQQLSTPSATRASDRSGDPAKALSCGMDSAVTAWYAESSSLAPPKDLQCQSLLEVMKQSAAERGAPLSVESQHLQTPATTDQCRSFSSDLWLLSGGPRGNETWLAECPRGMILTSVQVESTLYQRGVSGFECCEVTNAVTESGSACTVLGSLSADGVTASSAAWHNQCPSGTVITALHSQAHFHDVDAIKCCPLVHYEPAATCPQDAQGSVCGDRGYCTDGATCACKTGYHGTSCQLQCPGGVSQPCSGHGACQADGKCACQANFFGPDCSVADCNPSCVNGACENQGPTGQLANHRGSPFLDFEYTVQLGCTCYQGWTGADCSVPEECASGCPTLLLGNGMCNVECNNAACSFDKGDCDAGQPCPCDASFLRDGVCHPECHVAACRGENEDCEVCGDCSLASQASEPGCAQACAPSVMSLKECPGSETSFLADGVCNLEYNTSACAFDGGDCLTAEAEACAAGCAIELIGDGQCHEECLTSLCGFDLGDCDPITTSTSAPTTAVSNATGQSSASISNNASTTSGSLVSTSPATTQDACKAAGCNVLQIGNGICDPNCNVAACNFDDNDCFDCKTLGDVKCGSAQQGLCSASGKCLCFTGFSGLTCSTCDAAKACSTHGTCTVTDGVFAGCQCDDGWVGDDCSSFDVSVCVNGVGNVTAQQCICNPGWSGLRCDLCIDSSKACNDRGFCLSDPKDTTPAPTNNTRLSDRGCNCYEGWKGVQCGECDGSSCNFHGDCNDDDTCSCEPPYLGERCDSCSPSFCNFRGDCAVPNNGTGDATCECQLGWTGDRCDVCDTHFEGANCDICELGYFLNLSLQRCVKCTDCPVGFGASVRCYNLTDTSCAPCQDGITYSDLNTFAQECTVCSPCEKGFGVTAECVAGQDTQCRRCTNDVDFSDVADLTSRCQPCTHCDVGFGIDINCAEDRDTVCERCDDGSYSNHTKYEPCKLCPTTCTAGEELLGTCTAQASSLCTLCQSGFYKPSTGPALCTRCTTSCPAGQQLTGQCTATTTPVCTACPAGTFKASTGAASCQNKKRCGQGQRLTNEGTTSQDRTCSTCPSGQFQASSSHLSSTCSNCRSTCGSNQYRSGSCGGASDYGCSSCRSSCPAGQTLSGSCASNGNNNFGCSTCS